MTEAEPTLTPVTTPIAIVGPVDAPETQQRDLAEIEGAAHQGVA